MDLRTLDQIKANDVSDEEALNAQYYILEQADNVDDARNLLEACGFLPYDGGDTEPHHKNKVRRGIRDALFRIRSRRDDGSSLIAQWETA